MDLVEHLADQSIRRACGFAGLAIGTVMLALSFDASLSLRSGGAMAAVVALALAGSAWRAPRRNMRHSELWSMLMDHRAEAVRGLPVPQVQATLARVLRARLLWHADRVAGLALALGLPGLLLAALRG